MKKNYSIIIIIIFTLAILLGLYYVQYPIKSENLSLEAELQIFVGRKNIKIQKVEEIDNKIIVLYADDYGFGLGYFNKGLNGKCLLTSSSMQGGNTFQRGTIKTNKGNYPYFAGKNYDNKIKLIEFYSKDGKKLVYDISNDSFYILIMSSTNGVYYPSSFSYSRFDLLDENEKSIKNEIIEKYISENASGGAKTKVELSQFNFWYVLVIFISSTIIHSRYRVNRKNNIWKSYWTRGEVAVATAHNTRFESVVVG